MQHPDLNRVLSRDRLRELMRRDDLHGLARLGLHLSLIGLAGWLLAQAPWAPLRGVMIFVLGVLLVFLFAPLHECIHKTAFRSRRLNALVGWLCGLILFLPPGFFQVFHMAHHRHTQVAGRDPELDTPKPVTRARYVVLASGALYWSGQAHALARMFLGHADFHFAPEERRPALVAEARVFVGIYLLVFACATLTSWRPLLMFWLLPVLAGQPVLRLYLLAEHALCPATPDMLDNTRTTVSNPLVRLLAWNMPYHAEHHAWPAIPFHALPRTHHLVRSHLKRLSPGYVAVNRAVWRSLSPA